MRFYVIILEMKSGELLVNPYFFMALSREFVPNCDPDSTEHTLGRLAVASYEEGGKLPQRHTNDPSAVAIYSHMPSWAQGFESRVVCQPTLHGNMLIGIGLHNLSSNAKLRFWSERQEDGLTVLRSSVQKKPLPLRPGNDIKNASEFVANTAKSFFNQAA